MYLLAMQDVCCLQKPYSILLGSPRGKWCIYKYYVNETWVLLKIIKVCKTPQILLVTLTQSLD